ncbi:MAG: 1-acyl-sn-glycerol-3-phosphate acyltransferase [Bacteroidetes bacterium]|nr:1-acyl-sn-glycerol-3-phosphate acyltransferase [Bacteroidota bacterium]
MTFFKNIFKRLWVFYYYAVLLGFFLAFYPLYYFLLGSTKRYKAANKLREVWSHTLFFFIGFGYSIKYEDGFEDLYFSKQRKKGIIFCPNHSSYADIPLFLISVPGHYRFIAKSELEKIPVFGIFFRTIDISVDRTSTTDSFKAFEEAGKSLEENISLVMYPEGRTSRLAPRLLRFKNGPFKLAIEKKVPVVPVTFLDNWRLFPNDGKNYGKPGFTRAIVHTPISTDDLVIEDTEALKQRVFRIIEDTLKKEYESRFTDS